MLVGEQAGSKVGSTGEGPEAAGPLGARPRERASLKLPQQKQERRIGFS